MRLENPMVARSLIFKKPECMAIKSRISKTGLNDYSTKTSNGDTVISCAMEVGNHLPIFYGSKLKHTSERSFHLS